ncbi:DUF4241 domain-containing protein [Microvirga splendida]|uniref:DUF4241 domain-containing protein n=1 Tax=Microvirga splendida TaxID=2795727 RepID=A0ABS0Y4J2_9HYPH|nr:DUF4241 domain-containing protein [Microvirga splendida]MBJ6127202.1 DUF4241 domain-containing protein [Microvirga splendida]
MDIDALAEIRRMVRRWREVAMLNVPTGRVVACDPFFTGAAKALSSTCKPGSYPVRLFRSGSGANSRISVAELVIDPDVEPKSVAPCPAEGGEAGFAVESGLAAFMDETARYDFSDFLASYYAKNPQKNYYVDRLDRYFSSYAGGEFRKISDAISHKFSPESPNIIMFQSGRGDGMYRTWVTRGAQGELASYLIDFTV